MAHATEDYVLFLHIHAQYTIQLSSVGRVLIIFFIIIITACWDKIIM